VLAFGLPAAAEEGRDMGGWEPGGEYDSHYKIPNMDEFKARVQEIIEVTPLEGMSPGLGMIVKDDMDFVTKVHIAPKWFVKDIDVRPGEKIKIRGAWAEIKGEEVFMASKIKKDGKNVLKVRLTKNGKPFWVMSAEELARERKGLD
jgi:hypothetical protein